MRKFFISFCILFFSLLLLACKKDKLSGDYDAFEGTYEWQRSTGQNGSFLTLQTISLYQKDVGYTVTFKLNNKGEALFYKNGALISNNQYRINGKESNQYGSKEIVIKLKGKTKGMTVKDDILKLTLSGDTSLHVTQFPFPSIDKIENYKADYSGSSNWFIKK